MRNPRAPRGVEARATRRLSDLKLGERDSIHHSSRTGDWLLLAVVVVVLLGNGLYVWHQLGPEKDHEGRAVFFGVALLCVVWAAIVYTFKLSVSVRVGPHGLSVVRGPWRTELAWREVGRLMERVEAQGGQRYRWVVALARDGRRLQLREDLVGDYALFRLEVYERYRLWRDHGGTWGATNGGPFDAREAVSGQAQWWLLAGCALALPGLYLTWVLPELGLAGPVVLVLALICAVMSLRAFTRRQSYRVDAKAIEATHLGHTVRLAWRDVARIERTRLPFTRLLRLGISAGQLVFRLAARTDARIQSFDWYPRVPEYLTIRGAGRTVRIRLHRVAKPDELLAWIEFYERVGRRIVANEQRKTMPPTRKLSRELEQLDLSTAGSPADPWSGGQASDLPDYDADERVAHQEPAPAGDASADSWLRDEPPFVSSPPANPSSTPARATGRPTTGRPATRQEAEAYDPVGEPPVVATPWSDDTPSPSRANVPWGARPVTGSPAAASMPAPEPGDHALAGSIDQLWSPTEPHERYAERPAPPAPQPPPDPWIELEEASSAADEVDEDTPTEAIESLADAFAPWRTDPNWQRPQLPRFGPPASNSDER